jgi:hypothetical protein
VLLPVAVLAVRVIVSVMCVAVLALMELVHDVSLWGQTYRKFSSVLDS